MLLRRRAIMLTSWGKDKRGPSRVHTTVDGNSVEENIVLMDGARFYVKPSDYTAFVNTVHQVQTMSSKWYLVERTASITRLFFDLDFHFGVDVPALPDTAHMLEIIAKTTARMFPDEREVRMAVSVAKPYVKMNNDASPPRELLKAGFHVIFPTLIVDIPQARAIRKILICELQKEMPMFADIALHRKNWGDVLDPAVHYVGKGGLRMLYSYKCKPCTAMQQCKSALARRKSKVTCSVCHNQGRLHDRVASYYYPHSVVTVSEGVVSTTETSPKPSTEFCIYPFGKEQTPGYVVPPGLRACVTQDLTEFPCLDDPDWADDKPTPKRCKIRKGSSSGMGVGAPLRCPGYAMVCEIDVMSLGAQKLLAHIQSLKYRGMHPYQNIILSRIKAYTNKSKNAATRLLSPPFIFVSVDGEGSSWCPNKQDHHTSNNVWFYVDSRGCSIRCFSRKKMIRQGFCVPCEHFKTVPSVIGATSFQVNVWNLLVQEIPVAKPSTGASAEYIPDTPPDTQESSSSENVAVMSQMTQEERVDFTDVLTMKWN
jgi:hypothetical protein